MTTNFTVKIPHELWTKLHTEMIEVQDEQRPTRATIPLYPEFVQHLMKGMDTPAQEMIHAAVGIAGEGGEVLDLAKKVWIYGKPLDMEALIKELGDLRFYYQAMLNLYGLTDELVIAQNVKKLRARYSEGVYSDAQAIAQADKGLPPLGRDRNAPSLDRKFMGKGTGEGNDV